MRAMTFTVPGDPVPLARARVGKYSVYDAQKHEKFVAGMQISHQMAGQKPLNGPLEMEVIFYMPIPVKGKHKVGRPHFSKPDLDNLIKYVNDICNKVVFHDDCAVFRIVASKIYDLKPRTVFTLREMVDESVNGQEAVKGSGRSN